jgi:hypothetical protein
MQGEGTGVQYKKIRQGREVEEAEAEEVVRGIRKKT